MSHLDEGTLHALLDGELELAQVQEIQLHLSTCAACGSRLQDVKQFLAEADRLVGALEIPAGGSRAGHQPAAHREPPLEPAPPPRTFREPEPWAEAPPPLLLPDPLDELQRRKRWRRGLALAAMVGAVFLGGRLITSTLRPSKPELQFTERDLATPTPTAQPAVVSPEERGRAAAPIAKQSRPAPTTRAPAPRAAPPPEPKLLADQPAPGVAADQLDTVLTAAEDSNPVDDTVARAAESAEQAGEEQPRPEQPRAGQSRDEADLETRRAAAAALAELDRERLRSRANSATASLPRPEPAPAAEAPPAPRTLEQRAQIYLRIGLDEAVRQLGRPVHVIEGMSPEFIGLTQGRGVPGADAGRPVVRVVYLDRRGRMILLDQQRMRTGQAPGAATGALRWALGDVMLYLHGDAGGDVLRDLQRRVR
jgi:hypothetical protein